MAPSISAKREFKRAHKAFPDVGRWLGARLDAVRTILFGWWSYLRPRLAFLRRSMLARVKECASWTFRHPLRLLVSLVVIFFVVISVERFYSTTIEPFEVPKAYEKIGYTPTVFSRRVVDRIKVIQATIKAAIEEPNITVREEEPLDIQLLGSGLSLTKLIDEILDHLNLHPKRFNGEVKLNYCQHSQSCPDQATITFYASGRGFPKNDPAISVALHASDPETAVEEAAIFVLERLDPYRLAAYVGLVGHDSGRAQRFLQPTFDLTVRHDSAYISQVYSLWGAILDQDGKRDEAVQAYEESIRFDSRNASAYDNWALHLARLGDVRGAAAMFQQAIEANPRSANTLTNWCSFLHGLSNHRAEARAKCEAAVKIDPSNARALNALGMIEVENNEAPESIVCFRKAIQQDRGWSEPYTNWGVALRSQKKYSEAATKFRQATELDPRNWVAFKNWSGTLLELHNYQEAIEKAKIAIQLQPQLEPMMGELLKEIERDKAQQAK
jgi:tetratricopeptide (TPR) repeat protein